MSNNAKNEVLSNRTTKIMLKLCFLRMAATAIMHNMNEEGGGAVIEDAAAGMEYYFSELIDELDELGAKISQFENKVRSCHV